jgi:hypothetical protein
VSFPPPSVRPAPKPEPQRGDARGRGAVRALAASGVLALGAWGASGALAHDRPAELGAMAATGEIHLASAEDGTTVLTASEMVPGDAVSGTVTLQNTGDAAGDLRVDRSDLQDVLGRGRGRMSRSLLVRVDDVTGGAPQLRFSGGLVALDDLDLGALAAGERRTYRVTAWLPDGGRPSGPLAGDNALQAAGTEVEWTWHAEPVAPPAVPPAPTPTATPAPPAGDVPLPVQRPPSAASVLTLRLPWQRVLRTHGITVWGTCDQRCRLTFSAKVQTAPRHGARRRTVMRRRVFKVAGTKRTLQPGLERAIKLRLTRRAMRRLRSVLLVRGRAAVRVDARVRSSLGAATVKRRIVITTSRRAAQHRATQRGHR